MSDKIINKPSFGVIVGRFQVHELHDGHMELFRAVRGLHQRIIVFVGVNPGGASVHNPLDFDTRRRMIQAKFPEFSVAPLLDCSSDEAWSKNLDEEIGKFAQYGDVILYGGRDSFAPHYHGKFAPVELNLSIEASGTDIRNSLTNAVRESADFRAGVIYAINNLYPRVITCVDVAIMHRSKYGLQVALGRKTGEKLWRFVGGHAIPIGSFEDDAKREAYEETGVDVNSLVYLGSRTVDDWRWRNSPDKIKTLFFVGWSNLSKIQANDDIAELDWFTLGLLDYESFVNEHRPLFSMLMIYLENNGETI